MKTFNKGIALAVLMTVGAICQTASAMPAAMAGAGFGSVASEMSARPVETVGGRRHGGRYYRGGWDNGNAAAAAATAGVIGLAAGAILGAVFLVGLPEVVSMLFAAFGDSARALLSTGAHEVKGALYGLVIILFLRLQPEGLMGLWRDAQRVWTLWPLRY